MFRLNLTNNQIQLKKGSLFVSKRALIRLIIKRARKKINMKSRNLRGIQQNYC